MKFRTEYHPDPNWFPTLDPRLPVLMLGSCFADTIGQRLLDTGWQAAVNPCGTLYNPHSIAATIRHALDADFAPLPVRHPQMDLWFCYDFPTRFSRTRPQDMSQAIADALARVRSALQSAQALFVTFGTVWAFALDSDRAEPDGYPDGYIVANCHKMPADTFRRIRLGIDPCFDLWSTLLDRLHSFNPALQVIFTVSPVRHPADGFEGNARSKASLLLLCEKLASLPGCHYFPAYEILNDDLRDYRFYADDLTHPASAAACYIHEKFLQAFVSPTDIPYLKAREAEIRRSRHRPMLQN